jgi:hypothetical protein
MSLAAGKFYLSVEETLSVTPQSSLVIRNMAHLRNKVKKNTFVCLPVKEMVSTSLCNEEKK